MTKLRYAVYWGFWLILPFLANELYFSNLRNLDWTRNLWFSALGMPLIYFFIGAYIGLYNLLTLFDADGKWSIKPKKVRYIVLFFVIGYVAKVPIFNLNNIYSWLYDSFGIWLILSGYLFSNALTKQPDQSDERSEGIEMYESHPYILAGRCPCWIGEDAIQTAASIYAETGDPASFAAEMERRRVIGRKIWYDADEDTVFIIKSYAADSGGGCPSNLSLIGERCHCDHYNHSTDFHPRHYCKCGAEFYRPMFAPLFGDDVMIEPYKTVLAGDEECVIAIRIGKKEGGANDA